MDIEIYQKLLFLRTAEERLAKYYLDNKVFSFVHFCVGQEAVPVGVADKLNAMDRVFGNHRSHGHYLAHGGCFKSLVAELLGKKGGCSGGYGGSMHLRDEKVGFVGTTPILGSAVPLALGSAFEQKRKGLGITAVYFGDGAADEGQVYESINLAASMGLPVLFVMEDNGYSVDTKPSERHGERFKYGDIVRGFGVEYTRVSGSTYEPVDWSTKHATEFIRGTGRPYFLHYDVSRHMAHSAPLFGENKEKALERCPVREAKRILFYNGIETTDEELMILNDVDSIIKEVSEREDA